MVGMLKMAYVGIKKGTNQVLMVQNHAKFKKGYWAKKKAKSMGSQPMDSTSHKWGLQTLSIFCIDALDN